jgi:hypothetical protein
MKGTSTYLYEEVKKVLESKDIPVQNLAGLVTYGAPSLAGRNSGVSSLITNDGKNTTDSDFKIRHLLIH